MGISGLDFLLILLSPVVAIIVLLLLLAPLYRKAFERHKPVENELRIKNREFIRDYKERERELIRDMVDNPKCLSREKIDEYRKELNASREKHFRYLFEGLKKILRINLEESGASDFHKELKKDIRDIFK